MLIVLLSLALSACSVASDGSKSLPFQLRGNRVVVPAMVNGHGPFRFLLDTGAGRSAVSGRVAERLSLEGSARTLMMTPAGHEVRPTIPIELAIQGRAGVPVAATLLDRPSLGDLDGIVGQDVLSSLAYTIDYASRRLTWDSHPKADSGAKLALEFTPVGALVSIPAPNGGAEPFRLIPDTGADHIVLFARPGRPVPATTTSEVALLRTLAGNQLVRRVVLDRLKLGNLELRGQIALLLHERDHVLPPGDGLLPLHLFSKVTFNGPQGYIVLFR